MSQQKRDIEQLIHTLQVYSEDYITSTCRQEKAQNNAKDVR